MPHSVFLLLTPTPFFITFTAMFIKEIIKKNASSDKLFRSHRLMDSYRTPKGPRQRTILNLGRLDIPKDQWKILADQIEAEIAGQHDLFEVDATIKKLASHYAQLIVHKELETSRVQESGHAEAIYETVDINSLTHSKMRTLGAEYVGLATFRKLGLDSFLKQLGFSENQTTLSALMIIGKLVHPGSEQHIRRWAQYSSALDELLDTDFSHLPNNALYRISDLLFEHKDNIERYLCKRERDLFSLQEKIILYDLTNTYLEGSGKNNAKAHNGRSKEKRSDCPLLTLGMVIDELGFAKTSKIFQGNVSEPATLKEILKELQGLKLSRGKTVGGKPGPITVVMDAGIASETNLNLLRTSGYDYIVVARNKPLGRPRIAEEDWVTIKSSDKNKVEAKLIKQDGEQILYCKSFLKGQKEQSIRQLFEKRFEEDLQNVAAGLSKKGGIKRYDKVLQRIGRLREKYSRIAQYYDIQVHHSQQVVTALEWKFIKPEKAAERFSGSYFLRTSRTDLDEREIWSLYIMLTNLENSFRSLKTDLNLRPVYHQTESRCDSHLFITVLAYHLLNTIQTQLRQHDIHMQWWNIRERLSTHGRVTTSMTTQGHHSLHLRSSCEPESFHKLIYDALGLSYYPLKMKRIKL